MQVHPVHHRADGQVVCGQGAGPAGGVAGAAELGVGVEGALYAPARRGQHRPCANAGQVGLHLAAQGGVGGPLPAAAVGRELGAGIGLGLAGVGAVPDQLGAYGFVGGVQRQLGLANPRAGGGPQRHGHHGPGATGHGRGAGAGTGAGDDRGVGDVAGLHLHVAAGARQLGMYAQAVAHVDVPVAAKHQVAGDPKIVGGGVADVGQRLGPGDGQALQLAFGLQAVAGRVGRAGAAVTQGLPRQLHLAWHRAGQGGGAGRGLDVHVWCACGSRGVAHGDVGGAVQLQGPRAGLGGVLQLQLQAGDGGAPLVGVVHAAVQAGLQPDGLGARQGFTLDCQAGLRQVAREFGAYAPQLHGGLVLLRVGGRQLQVECGHGQVGLHGQVACAGGGRLAIPQSHLHRLPAALPAAFEGRVALQAGTRETAGQARQTFDPALGLARVGQCDVQRACALRRGHGAVKTGLGTGHGG